MRDARGLSCSSKMKKNIELKTTSSELQPRRPLRPLRPPARLGPDRGPMSSDIPRPRVESWMLLLGGLEGKPAAGTASRNKERAACAAGQLRAGF